MEDRNDRLRDLQRADRRLLQCTAVRRQPTGLFFVLPIHNLWRAKKLNDINYGKRTFRMKDSAEVEKIFADAGKGSAAESTYEAGPQSVTQVPKKGLTVADHFHRC